MAWKIKVKIKKEYQVCKRIQRKTTLVTAKQQAMVAKPTRGDYIYSISI